MTSFDLLDYDLKEALSIHLYSFEQISFGATKMILNTKLPTSITSRLNLGQESLKKILSSDF